MSIKINPTPTQTASSTGHDPGPVAIKTSAALFAFNDDTVRGREQPRSFWSNVASTQAPSLADVRSGAASIQPGEAGESISRLQELLTTAGYGVAATGTYGPTTRGLVEELQRDVGLPPNGVIDRPTLEALENAAAHPPGRFDYAGTTPEALRDKHAGHADSFRSRATPVQQRSIDAFRAHYEANRARYEAVAEQANMPPELIAAIHWRESTGDFGTYLHNGDPLGAPTVHVPRGILFNDWESAAADALRRQAQPELGLTRTSTDMPAIAAYAELYNGTGYHGRERPSPYVYAGTDEYNGGKYVADGVYDPNHYDQQPGVLALMRAVRPNP